MAVITGYDIPKLNYCRHRHKTILNESVCTQRTFCNPHKVFQIDDWTAVLYGQTLQHWNWFKERHWVPISVGDDGLNWLLHGIIFLERLCFAKTEDFMQKRIWEQHTRDRTFTSIHATKENITDTFVILERMWIWSATIILKYLPYRHF